MNRVIWIDLAKIVGIYLVVLGHALHNGSGMEGFMRDFIYIFHMPLFFFLSGYLFSVKTKFKPFLEKNIKSLIIPYFSLNVIALVLLIPVYIHGKHDILDLIIRIITGNGHAPAGPAWFLLSLFWIRLMAFGYIKFNLKLQLLLLVGVISVAYTFPFHLVLRFDSALMAFPFFIMGNVVKRYDIIENKMERFSKTFLSIVGVVLFAILLWIAYFQKSTSVYSLNFGQYPYFYYCGAVVGILLIICLCKLYTCREFNIFWNTIASGTLIIMGLHGVFYIYLNYIIPHFTFLGVFNPILICAVVIAVMYYPILILKKYCSSFLGMK